jgi:beta-lactam-binding protein with PASTA domain
VKNFLLFLKSKIFLKQLAIFLLLLFVVMWIILTLLDVYTRHGESVEVPDFKGIKIENLNNFIKDKKLRYRIIDSVYDPKAAKGIVVHQEPEKKIKVKENRTIYLYVTTLLPPQVVMPKLKDKSLRQAISMLETYGLKFGRAIPEADQCENCILEQEVKGKRIEPGTLISKGTVVDLQVGNGLAKEENLPNAVDSTNSVK